VALDTYDALLASGVDWLNRAGFAELTARFPDFVTLCETMLNRDLRTRQMETQTDSAAYRTTAGTATLDLPADYLEARGLILQTSPVAVLSYVTPAALSATYGGGTTGRPAAYTMIGNRLKFGPTPDAAYGAELTYYGKIPALSASNPTNWVLAEQPDLYLYGSLLQSAPFLQDDARLSLWGGLYDAALGRVQSTDQRARWGGAPLTIKVRAW
jgi:hypothetical protein